MRKGVVVLLTAVLCAAAGGTLRAEQRGGFLLGVDSQIEVDAPRTGEAGLKLFAPFGSYFLTDRLRLDMAPRMGFIRSSDGDSVYELGLSSGLRYYYFRSTSGKLLGNAGFWLGADLIEGGEGEGFDDRFAGDRRDDVLDFRISPLELEWWGWKRSALILGAEYGGTLYDRGPDELGFGLTAGYRWRIK